jgi:hypothetical protein
VTRQRNHGKSGSDARARLADLATVQGGVVSLSQLGDEGVSRQLAAERAAAAQLHRVHRGVYAMGHRSVSRQTLLRAALLACGEGAVISHVTAAALWGMFDQWPHLIDVTVPVEAGRKIAGIRPRRCRYPAEDEITAHQGVVCTTPARVLVDLAGIWGSGSLRKVVERTAVLKRLDLVAVDFAIENAKRRRGLRALQATLAPWRTGKDEPPDLRSDFEALAFPRLLEMGLPLPECNPKLRFDDEVLMVDFLWREQLFILETDGAATHETPVAFQRDRRRDQLLVAGGYRVMHATWDQVRDELDGVVTRIATALARQYQ